MNTEPISSEDSEAIAKLAAKIEKLETAQERMRSTNAAIRKHKKAGADAQIEALMNLGFKFSMAQKLLVPDFAGRVGFPSFTLKNNNAEIRRCKARIEELEARAVAPVAEGGTNGDVSWGEDREMNRVWVEFPGKPDPDVRKALKSAGFRWAPSLNRWQRHTSNAAIFHAQDITERFGA